MARSANKKKTKLAKSVILQKSVSFAARTGKQK